LRQLDGYEISLWVKVVFAGLIDHAQLSVVRGLRIADEAVNFTKLQRGGISLVLDAENKAGVPGLQVSR
jgi:hypothetical protein